MQSPIAIALFVTVIVSTLLITRWAARRTHSRSEFYVAGSSITGTQNGLAIAGDFMSASTILGVAGLAFSGNSDAVLYIVAPLLGFTIIVLIVGVVVMAVLTFHHVDYDLGSLYSIAREQMDHVLTGNRTGALNSLFSTLSLGLALSLGVCGLPHVLMRFFTVPDARQARRSIIVAMVLIALVFLIVLFVLSYAAIAFLYGKPEFFDGAGVLRGGANMAVVHVSRLLGGDVLMGIVSAVTFATILAVVAGLTMASAGALAHDLYAQVFRRGKASEAQELRVFRFATLAVTVVAALLGIAFKGTNISFLVSLAFSVAASANFPVLMLSLYWRGLTRRGALVGGAVGLISSTGMLIAGPAIWVDALGYARPLFGSNYPTLIALPAALFTAWAVSMLDTRNRDGQAQRTFDALAAKSQALA
jgi:cation/acetate symporter